jgi:hypothetical protein
VCWSPNGPKLSDGGWRCKSWNTEKTRPPDSVRWSALLGIAGEFGQADTTVRLCTEGSPTHDMKVAGVDNGVEGAQTMRNTADHQVRRLPRGTVKMDGLAILELDVGDPRWAMQGKVEDTVAHGVGPRLRSRASPADEKCVELVGRMSPVKFHGGRGDA